MDHLPPLVYDLTIILLAAAASTLLFSRLKQPIVLGYLIAGFVVGPHFPLFPSVVDTQGVSLWAELGVIFLLFGLGLEFSFKKLAKVGRSASIAATFELITMTAVGYLFGRAIGWNGMDSIFLGAILSMSSTTIIIRAFDETGAKGKGFAGLVFGILIVEDLMAILLMVVLAAISVPGTFSGANLAFLSGRLGFFLLLWFLIGIYVLPSLLKKVRNFLSDEIMLVVSIALCFLMVVLASKAGFSAALGAFIMGSILAETEEGARIEHLLLPVKDLFAAVFFVSVGMLIDPAVLREHFSTIVMITLITIVGKLLGSGLGAALSGRSLRHSVQAGMSLAQIGEFSFIIATLGVTLKVTSDFLYPIVIAVSAVTTFTTPYMIKLSGPFYDWLEKRLPAGFLNRMSQYEAAMSTPAKEGALGLLWRVYGLAALLNSVLVLAVGLASARFLLPLLTSAFGDQPAVRAAACLATLAACSPFLLAITLKAPKKLSREETNTLARLRRLQAGVLAMRLMLGLFLTAAVIQQFSSSVIFPLVVLVAMPALIFAFRRFIEPLYTSMESHFLGNLNAKELAAMEQLAASPELAPWNATLISLELPPESELAGKTLEESRFRSATGTTVAMIDRGKRRILAPKRSDPLFPGDRLYLIGTEEQLASAQKYLEKSVSAPILPNSLYGLESVRIADRSPHAGKTIHGCGIGEKLGGLIMGIERGGLRMLNPEPTTALQEGDLLWVFGNREEIDKFRKLEA